MKRSKRITLWSVAFIALVALVLMAAGSARASGWPWAPEAVAVFPIEEAGLWCVTDQRSDGPHTTCYCPCDSGCEFSPNGETPVPSETPTPATPEPTEKPKCNSGRGNGSEGDPDCDPGNSGGHNQGGD